MYFRLTFDKCFLAIEDPKEFCFTTELDDATVSIDLRELEPYKRWSCIVTMEREPPRKVADIFAKIADGSLTPRDEWESHGVRDGELLGPPGYRDFIDNIQTQLAALARRTVSLLKWRLGIQASGQMGRENTRLHWSIDGNEFRSIPGVMYAAAMHTVSFRPVGDVLLKDVESLVRKNVNQPLGHELLREAANLRRSTPRGAIVLAVMAAEVGLKQCIADLVPDSQWLLFNAPTPPITKMLKELLPTLPSRCDYDDELLPPKLYETIKKAVTMRNDIVHRGDHPKAAERIEEVLLAIEDLLRRLDYLRGYQWAVRHFRDKT